MGDGGIVGAHAFRGLRLNTDLVRSNSQQFRKMLANAASMRTDLRLRKDQRGIKVGDLVACIFHPAQRFFQKHRRVGALPSRFRRREQCSDVWSSNASQQRVSDGMQQDVPIGMTAEPLGIVERNAANLQGDSSFELVRVPSVADTEGGYIL